MAAVAHLRVWARAICRSSPSFPPRRLPSSVRFVNSDARARLGLRFPEPESEDAETPEQKSRNEKKREAKRAFKWGMDLARLPSPQIKRILKVAQLEQEVFEALMLVKRLGPDVREGKRRQFNYIVKYKIISLVIVWQVVVFWSKVWQQYLLGRLLREAQPELMDALIQASKDGDTGRLHSLSCKDAWAVDSEEDVESEVDDTEEEETDNVFLEIADRWFEGLVDKDSSVTSEVYSLYCVDFDRQELRKLVRRVQFIQSNQLSEENKEGLGEALAGAKMSLCRFLRALAKKTLTM